MVFVQTGQQFILQHPACGTRHTLAHIGGGTWALGMLIVAQGQGYFSVPLSTIQAGAAVHGLRIRTVAGQ